MITERELNRSRYEITSHVELRNGKLYVTRYLEGLEAPYTKWDFLSDKEREDYTNTPCGDGTVTCSQCNELLLTEADFAKHYTVTDVRYFNLGACPNKKEDKNGSK